MSRKPFPNTVFHYMGDKSLALLLAIELKKKQLKTWNVAWSNVASHCT